MTANRTARRQLGRRGPEAVLASLTRGLGALALPFELNPRHFGSGETVAVLSDLDALGEAIQWRQQSEDRRLLAGPNLVVLPTDARSLMTAAEIDVCVVPSEWVKRLYEENAPELAGRITVWPAGVDPDYWKPRPSRRAHGRRALVYLKKLGGQRNADDAEVRGAEAALMRAGFTVTTLRYGTFRHKRYRQALQEVDLLVFFSPTESQCLALVEAWASGVPTFVWSCGRFQYQGRVYKSSSAPYLSRTTGRAFDDTSALESLVNRWDELQREFDPRAWVLQHMTDTIAARAFWELAYPNG